MAPTATQDLLVVDAYIADLRRDAGWVTAARPAPPQPRPNPRPPIRPRRIADPDPRRRAGRSASPVLAR